MKSKRNRINGWIILNKPLGITSSDAVNKVKWLLKPEKIGHAGTLDPLASGVLPLALGEATKCINLLMDAKKTYSFTITFGERRSTDDAEGDVVATSMVQPTEEQLRAILDKLRGQTISQVPPVYSAIKIDGERAYARARAGETIEMPPRQVTIYGIKLLSFSEKQATITAVVSKGTYIRSLGRDIAQAAGTEGFISMLHRNTVGPFWDINAISLDFIEESVHKAPPNEGTPTFVLPLHTALDDIPALALTAGHVATLRHGQQVQLSEPHPDTPLLGAMLDGQLVGLVKVEGNRVVTVRLLNT